MGEELLRSSVAPGLMGADGVIGPFPGLQLLVERGDLERAGGDLIALLRVGAVGTFDVAMELGRAGRQDEPAQAALRAGLLEEGGELTAAVHVRRLILARGILRLDVIRLVVLSLLVHAARQVQQFHFTELHGMALTLQ